MSDIWCGGLRPGATEFTTFRSVNGNCREAAKPLGPMDRIHILPMRLSQSDLPVAADPNLGGRLDAIG